MLIYEDTIIAQELLSSLQLYPSCLSCLPVTIHGSAVQIPNSQDRARGRRGSIARWPLSTRRTVTVRFAHFVPERRLALLSGLFRTRPPTFFLPAPAPLPKDLSGSRPLARLLSLRARARRRG